MLRLKWQLMSLNSPGRNIASVLRQTDTWDVIWRELECRLTTDIRLSKRVRLKSTMVSLRTGSCILSPVS